ncbi:MAG: copper homeostasis protein CutC [Vicinamibacterales bacterium]
MTVLVEACVETAAEARAAEQSGAGRIELCADLEVEGTTPADATLSACVAAVSIPVHVMIRPRGGRFVYTAAEGQDMLDATGRARALGARGIVTGALTAAGGIDVPLVAALLREAAPVPVTFHRAFDAVTDQAMALEQLVQLGIARVLTSGGADTALAGADGIAALVRQARDRLIVVAAGRVRPHNLAEIVARTGVREVHWRQLVKPNGG